MEPIESSETSAYINTLTPGTFPKEKKLQSKHGESLKSRNFMVVCICISCGRGDQRPYSVGRDAFRDGRFE